MTNPRVAQPILGAAAIESLFSFRRRVGEVEWLVLIDLKDGVSCYRYRDSPKVEALYEMLEVMRATGLMAQRQTYMRENGIELWRGGRIFVVIDEYTNNHSRISRKLCSSVLMVRVVFHVCESMAVAFVVYVAR